MGFWLAEKPGVTTSLKRFDPAYWTVDFPRPMVAAVCTTGPHSLRVDAVFYRKNDLAGLIWASADAHGHALLRYATSRDCRGCSLSFRWRSARVLPLDAVNGPTLTIEGRDADGAPRAWYVRLWNYAAGTPEDATVTLDFSTLDGGFLLPGEADPVWAGDVDRMFVSLVAPGYDASDAALAAPVEGWAEVSDIACDGAGSVLDVGDVIVPPHGLGIATGYDDLYNLTPARVVRAIERLGYRGDVNHYAGMSHYFRLGADGPVVDGVNVAAAAWHRSFAEALAASGMGLITSLSYELFDAHCPEGWKQRAADGAPALTGYSPPSTLLSPANDAAMAYLAGVATALVGFAVEAGLAAKFQIGEPWWWVQGGAPCLYDDGAVAAFAPVAIGDVDGALSAGQLATLDAAGACLAASTAGLFAAVQAAFADCARLLLAYVPGGQGNRVRMNLPTGWAGQFDVLQLEAYEWVTAGRDDRAACAAAGARLGYPASEQHYLGGFAAGPGDWWAIVAATEGADAAHKFIWALPQVMRDGFVYFEEEARVEAFDDVVFPLEIGREATVTPGFSTAVTSSMGGWEQRNADWAQGRLSFDAGPGVRSEADIGALIAFFRARRGMAKAFRFRDPNDCSSAGMTGTPGAFDQVLGVGDGVRTRFDLVKIYGAGADAERRAISRPVVVSVRVGVDGVELADGWSLDGGTVVFAEAPEDGVAVTAGFLFDVPVRFASDRLEIRAGLWRAGEAVACAMVEVRE